MRGSTWTSHWLDPNVFPLHLRTEPPQISAVHFVYTHDTFFVCTWKEKEHHVCTAISWGLSNQESMRKTAPQVGPTGGLQEVSSRPLENWMYLGVWIVGSTGGLRGPQSPQVWKSAEVWTFGFSHYIHWLLVEFHTSGAKFDNPEQFL